MKRGMPSGAQTPDGIIFLLALIFSKAPPRYPPHQGAHWAYTTIRSFFAILSPGFHNRRLEKTENGDTVSYLYDSGVSVQEYDAEVL